MRSTATPLAMHFKLSKTQRAITDEEKWEMKLVPYSNVVGSLMYLMICTRPDIAHAISTTSRYMADYGRQHWSALKWTLRYLVGADKLGIVFNGEGGVEEVPLVGYCDSDYAANIDTRRSQTGCIFTLFGSAICWKSSLQSVVALSTTEAEYMSLTSAVKEGKWLLGLVSEFGLKQQSISVHCGIINGALCLAKHQTFHERSKHIDVRLHFIRDEVENGRVKLVKINTAHNPADMLTKPLSKEKFQYYRRLVSLCATEF
ncbi:secreted RxLR effector protein 161-like [Salvia splendens]|uniref:secreted RxLR effector protein 161-like n=1 Tax=Salvia splendens TaxID=180675 RepID=UPI001C258F91|nr:secreted RxLR effector protein 161-like [Salvia splendens]